MEGTRGGPVEKSPLHTLAFSINWVVEKTCALLVAVMVVVIWFEVVERYVLKLGVTWTEEFSRYVMIWAALLAVSCGFFYREHIGLNLMRQVLPAQAGKALSVILDLISLAFFLFLAWYGIGMARSGSSQYASIFGMNMVVPFAAVPVSALLAAFQIFAAMLRDWGTADIKAD